MSGPICPDLKWQLTDTYNIGVESNMWNGLLGLELDVFYMKTHSFSGRSVWEISTFFRQLLPGIY